MQCDICPAEGHKYISTCPTVIPQICACGKQILTGWKLIFGYMAQWQQIHRTAEGQQTAAFHCTMHLLPLDHISKNQSLTIGTC